jgi:hypothetical protein
MPNRSDDTATSPHAKKLSVTSQDVAARDDELLALFQKRASGIARAGHPDERPRRTRS